jgi:hypothetical protein
LCARLVAEAIESGGIVITTSAAPATLTGMLAACDTTIADNS